MALKARFKVTSKSKYKGETFNRKTGTHERGTIQNICFAPVYIPDPSHPDNELWAGPPPDGFELKMLRADLGAYFEIDEEYYFEFTKIDAAKTAPAPSVLKRA